MYMLLCPLYTCIQVIIYYVYVALGDIIVISQFGHKSYECSSYKMWIVKFFFY